MNPMKSLLVASFILALCTTNQVNGQSTTRHKAFTVTVSGKGDPVFFFPGFGCTAAVWDQTIQSLGDRYECHAFTFAGFGDVPPVDTPWLAVIRDEVVKYAKAHTKKPIQLVGHSLGGTLAFWLAATEQGLCKQVIAVDALPSTGALMIPGFKAGSMVYNNPYSTSMLKMDSSAFHTMIRQQVAGMCLNKDKHDLLTRWMTSADRKTFVYGYIDLLNLDLRETIAAISVPVTVLAATHPGRAVVEPNWNKQLERLKNKTIFFAEGAAHFIMFDQPEWLHTKIKETIAR